MDHLEPGDFDKLLSPRSGQKAVVMIYADWCSFCQRFKPVFESALASAAVAKYGFFGAKLNEDENPLWDRFSINAVPTVIAFDGGRIAARKDAKMGVGLGKADLDSLLKSLR